MRLLAILVTLGLSALSGCAGSSAPPVVLNLGAPPVPGTPPRPKLPTIDRSLPKLITVRMQTTEGEIVVELDHERAPITVENFLRYADRGEYNGTIFHRVVPNFVVQGGGFTLALVELKGDAPIKNEWQNGLKNVRGTIAMARDADPDTATREFYFNVKDNARLDTPRDITGKAGYAVFGHVVSGMNVIDEMVKADTYFSIERDMRNIPVRPVVITSVTR